MARIFFSTGPSKDEYAFHATATKPTMLLVKDVLEGICGFAGPNAVYSRWVYSRWSELIEGAVVGIRCSSRSERSKKAANILNELRKGLEYHDRFFYYFEDM